MQNVIYRSEALFVLNYNTSKYNNYNNLNISSNYISKKLSTK